MNLKTRSTCHCNVRGEQCRKKKLEIHKYMQTEQFYVSTILFRSEGAYNKLAIRLKYTIKSSAIAKILKIIPKPM